MGGPTIFKSHVSHPPHTFPLKPQNQPSFIISINTTEAVAIQTQFTKPPKIPLIKKMGLTTFFKHKETTSTWPWPSCKHPRTDSFRHCSTGHVVEPAYSDVGPTFESWFTDSSESGSFSTVSDGESLESVMRGVVRSGRFFCEPDDTKSILGEPALEDESVVALAVESDDPFVDFRVSMEEIVEAHGLKDWECLMELLQWYLKMNGKKTHRFIVGAFVDLLVGIVSSSLECEGGNVSLFGDLIGKKTVNV